MAAASVVGSAASLKPSAAAEANGRRRLSRAEGLVAAPVPVVINAHWRWITGSLRLQV